MASRCSMGSRLRWRREKKARGAALAARACASATPARGQAPGPYRSAEEHILQCQSREEVQCARQVVKTLHVLRHRVALRPPGQANHRALLQRKILQLRIDRLPLRGIEFGAPL